MTSLLASLTSLIVTKQGTFSHNLVKWDLNSKGDFLVKSYYLKLLLLNCPFLQFPFERGFPYWLIWRSLPSSKVSFFVWEATWRKILTCDSLQRRGKILVSRCYMCKRDLELVDHLLLHYPFTRALWELVFSCLGVFWVFIILLAIVFWLGKVTLVGNRKTRTWALPHVTFWSIWREHNQRVFERFELSLEWLKDNVIKTLIKKR